MSRFDSIDLSKLPPPEVIMTVDFEVLLAEMKAKAIELVPELSEVLALESDPATKLLRVCAYYRMLDRLEFNDGARANMLALATGTNLDGLGALWGVQRLVIEAADDTTVPATAQVLEGDIAFRARIQLSLEGLSTAGPRGSYIFWALSASGLVKDASVSSPAPGQVVVNILSHEDDGTPSAALLDAVNAVLNDEDVRPLTDQVFVQPALIVPYTVEATLTLYSGPDASTVEVASEAALVAYIDEHHRLGHDITLSGLYAALHQPGVQNVTIAAPLADIVIGADQAAFCTSDALAISIGGRDV
jgi:phage-related baseplate assembly protein